VLLNTEFGSLSVPETNRRQRTELEAEREKEVLPDQQEEEKNDMRSEGSVEISQPVEKVFEEEDGVYQKGSLLVQLFGEFPLCERTSLLLLRDEPERQSTLVLKTQALSLTP
jgi:hypothetical protein